MAKKIDLSLIIPTFNEEKRLLKRFSDAYIFLKSHFNNLELIFVNDGSVDKTEKVLQKLVIKYPAVKIISYPKNRGKGYAIKQGVLQAQGQVIGFTDADFAVDLDGAITAFNSIKQGADIVIGDRNSTKSKVTNQPNFKRRIFGRILGLLNQFFLPMGDINDSQNGFKFFKNKVAKDIFPKITIDRWLFDIQLLSLAKQKKYNIIQQPVYWQEIGESKVNMLKDLPKISWDLFRLYFQFINTRFFCLLLAALLLVILTPFLINPVSLTRRNGDYSDLVWPDYYFIKQSIIKHQQIPLWNPTLFSGIPEIANPQSPLIYPPNALVLLLPIDLAIVILFFLHAFIGGVFLFKLTRQSLGWSTLGAIAATFTFVFSPFFWTKIAVGHLSQIFAIFLTAPILFFGSEFLKTKRLHYMFLTALILSLQYLNYPTIWYFTNFFGVIFLVGLFVTKIFKKNFLVIFAPIISLILISPIFLIQLQAGPLITRSILNLNDLAIPIWSLSRFIKSILIPSNFLADNETEVWLYPSLIALLLATYGFWKIQKKLKLILGSILILLILITLGSKTPVFGLLTQYFPGFSYLRVSTRDWFVFIILISFLVGFSLEQIKNKWRKYIFILLVIDLLFFSMLRIWFVPKFMLPSSTLNLQNLTPDDISYRTYCTNRCLSARDFLPKGVITADGYHLLILQDYRLAISQAGGYNPPEYTGNLPTYSVASAQPNAQKLGLMTVKWVISSHALDDSNFLAKKSQNGYTLFENKLAKKRFFFKSFDNPIEIKTLSPNSIVLKTSGSADTLVIADSFYPGWEGSIDGNSVIINKYDNWARSIAVPDGEHIILLEYKPFENIFTK